MNRPQLVIAPGREKAILRRHPWIFSGAVRSVDGNPHEGDLVDVCSADGRWLAAGHYQEGESIVCKVLSFDTTDIDSDFYLQRFRSAIDYRRQMGFFNYLSGDYKTDSLTTNVFRLVHAEGDCLPGLVVDWYNGVLVLQAHSVGMHRLFPFFAELLCDELKPYGLKAVFDKSSSTVPGGSSDGFLWGEELPEMEVTENGIKLLINFYEGQKTGFFVDQRENRLLVQSLAKGCRVLNCFGYTGGFSLAALRGGAEYVETVDVSRKAIELCNRNVALNFGSEAPHQGTVADVLKYFTALDKRFSFIILDPPAFAKNHRVLKQGLKGYRTINQSAMECIEPGGLLMTFSCSQAVSQDDFKTMVFTAAANAHRNVRIVRQLPHAPDHPVSIYHPEGEYLKGLLLQIE